MGSSWVSATLLMASTTPRKPSQKWVNYADGQVGPPNMRPIGQFRLGYSSLAGAKNFPSEPVPISLSLKAHCVRLNRSS